jgi:hypothetical protein
MSLSAFQILSLPSSSCFANLLWVGIKDTAGDPAGALIIMAILCPCLSPVCPSDQAGLSVTIGLTGTINQLPAPPPTPPPGANHLPRNSMTYRAYNLGHLCATFPCPRHHSLCCFPMAFCALWRKATLSSGWPMRTYRITLLLWGWPVRHGMFYIFYLLNTSQTSCSFPNHGQCDIMASQVIVKCLLESGSYLLAPFGNHCLKAWNFLVLGKKQPSSRLSSASVSMKPWCQHTTQPMADVISVCGMKESDEQQDPFLVYFLRSGVTWRKEFQDGVWGRCQN